MSKNDFNYLNLKIQRCPLCASRDFIILSRNDRYFMGLETVGCSVCGLIQTNPRPSEEGLSLFYQKDYRIFYQGISRPSDRYINEMRKKERLRDVAYYLRNIGFIHMDSTILDIGCSEGTFFEVLREVGFEGGFYGIEPNAEFREYANTKENIIIYESIDDVFEEVDVITLNHVFEHLLNPNEFLKRLRSIMKDSAYLYIDVPNADEYSSINDLHLAHIFHFTKRTLSNLVERAGFVTMVCESYEPISHPKSIRLVAKKSMSNFENKKLSALDEIKTWKKIKRLSILKKKIYLLVRKLPFTRLIYHALFKK